jgi:hypothetical protein
MMAPRSMVLELEPGSEMHMEQLSIIEHVSTAFWLIFNMTLKVEVGVIASELCNAWSVLMQLLKQLHVGVRAIEIYV